MRAEQVFQGPRRRKGPNELLGVVLGAPLTTAHSIILPLRPSTPNQRLKAAGTGKAILKSSKASTSIPFIFPRAVHLPISDSPRPFRTRRYPQNHLQVLLLTQGLTTYHNYPYRRLRIQGYRRARVEGGILVHQTLE